MQIELKEITVKELADGYKDSYILTREDKHLNLRQFDDKMKRKVYEKQNGICPICNNKFDISEMEADHILPWHSGGGKQKSKIVKCSANMITEQNQENKTQNLPKWKVFIRF